MKRNHDLSLVWPALLLGCAACGESSDSRDNAGLKNEQQSCASGLFWDAGAGEGPEMFPGRACISCHSQENASSPDLDAPNFAFAGTVFSREHEPDDCLSQAADGARLTITDDVGKTFVAVVDNSSGNFSFDREPGEEITFPVVAKVEFQGRVREMATPQMSGDCNSCHTQSGDEGAPGRIVLP